MISAVVPGTVGLAQGRAAVVALTPPTPAPPEVALAVGEAAAAHWAGLDPVTPLGAVGVVGLVAAGVSALPPPAEGMAPPPVLALALLAPASANAAKLGSMKWATRKSSLSWACGVS
jgi:hypothetical protein